MGGSFTSGWLSAGNLELQPVANIESEIRRSVFTAFTKQISKVIWDCRWDDFLKDPIF